MRLRFLRDKTTNSASQLQAHPWVAQVLHFPGNYCIGFFSLRMINQISINEDRRALITYPKCTFFFLDIAKAKKCRNPPFVVLPSQYLNKIELLILKSYATCKTKVIDVTRSRVGLPLELPASRLVGQYCYVIFFTNPSLM